MKPGRESEAEAIFRKWELDFAVIGEVTDTGRMQLEWNGEIVCDIPLEPLADEAPEYDRPYLNPDEYRSWAGVRPLGEIPAGGDVAADLLKMMGSPSLASRRWIWEQYDSQVGADTVQRPGGDSAVVRVHGTRKALAITTDCTPRYCFANPREGGKQAIAEAYRNLSAVGATPLAVTNCLNFGNPQRPEIMAQFVGCLDGMGEACRALDFPVVSGNVSLYNESKATGGGSAILPTPAIGGVGLLSDWASSASIAFKAEGEPVLLVGGLGSHLGQSTWLHEIHGRRDGEAPPVDLDQERRHGEFVRKLVADGLVTAVHDVSDGGPLVAVTEMALAGDIGFVSSLPPGPVAFAEDQGRYVITSSSDKLALVRQRADEAGIILEEIGKTGGSSIRVDKGSGQQVAVALVDLRSVHEGFFPALMHGELGAG